METERAAFLFSEPSHTAMDSMTQMPESFPSFLNLDDSQLLTFLDEFPDYTMLEHDHDFFHFSNSNHDQNMSSFSLDPQLSYTDDSFLFDDVETDTDMFHPTQPETCTSIWSAITPALTPVEKSDESDQNMDCDAWLVQPAESFEGFGEPVFTPPMSEMGVNPALSGTNSSGKGCGSEEIGEEEEEETDEERKVVNSSSKNLVSERNRRKRLSRQLLALRGLVPNITKMDKRSVLVDALAYLSSIHEEIAELKKQVKHPSNCVETQTECTLPSQRTLESRTWKPKPKPKPKSKPSTQIVEIDAEKIEDQRFVVKITCNGGAGSGGEVLHIIESLGFDVTYTALDKIKPTLVLLTTFLRVRKQGKMTEEKLKDSIRSTALRTGLSLKNP